MENLNDLIWTDEEDSDNNIQPQHDPMKETCMIAFCTAGSLYACKQDWSLRTGTCYP
ncbi:MAG: hypothetical protein K2I22_09565 [Lachnospiraceae bacterium]|nr:hypothetical protein [Lachnospiraceae bacterium]